MIIVSLLNFILALLLAPLLFGIINRVKAMFAGRHGQSLFQLYYDIYKLMGKDFVYSKTTSVIFRIAPIVGLVSMIFVLALIPVYKTGALLSFPGDLLVIVYVLSLMRFLIIIGALDTGSSFEGMGASREAIFSAFSELSVFMVFISISFISDSFSLSQIISKISEPSGFTMMLMLLSLILFVLLLLECARIPFDDPNTHLELTMIHEVMVLDHGSLDLALVDYASALKMWFFASLTVQIALPVGNLNIFPAQIIYLAAIALIAVLVGVVESTMARLRIRKIPSFLLGVFFLTIFVFIFIGGRNL